ncbi:unnamed protein product [Pleuronectes platessa]|uniref:Uncharacterized protein n=1 Tax=Pleuronectes platessa TaxID=8262 RepID=A0A9N7V733_PLEPL|nr:unnamed protein product [Pleuronectes platessa]
MAVPLRMLNETDSEEEEWIRSGAAREVRWIRTHQKLASWGCRSPIAVPGGGGGESIAQGERRRMKKLIAPEKMRNLSCLPLLCFWENKVRVSSRFNFPLNDEQVSGSGWRQSAFFSGEGNFAEIADANLRESSAERSGCFHRELPVVLKRVSHPQSWVEENQATCLVQDMTAGLQGHVTEKQRRPSDEHTAHGRGSENQRGQAAKCY